MASQSSEDVYYDTALELVKKAGELARTAFHQPRPLNIQTKSSNIDLVTETDKAVEELLIDGLSNAFPDHKFLAEESADAKMTLTDAPTWIIDPIDGTTNFVHRIPHIAVCVGLYINRKPSIGIVYNPILNDLYTARAGKGAYRNGFRIHSADTQSLDKSIVITSMGGCGSDKANSYLKTASALMAAGFRGGRSFGSAALNMCYVAQGSCDAYFEIGIHVWDVAASGLIVVEAGGAMLDPSGGPFDPMSRRVVAAANDVMAKEVTGVVTTFDLPRDD